MALGLVKYGFSSHSESLFSSDFSHKAAITGYAGLRTYDSRDPENPPYINIRPTGLFASGSSNVSLNFPV